MTLNLAKRDPADLIRALDRINKAGITLVRDGAGYFHLRWKEPYGASAHCGFFHTIHDALDAGEAQAAKLEATPHPCNP